MSPTNADRRPRYFIGNGQKLTEDKKPILGAPNTKPEPYTPDAAAARLRPKLQETYRSLEALPRTALPGDHGVVMLTMHPEFLAKSYFPYQLLHHFGLEAVGSRSRLVLPERWSRQSHPREPAQSIELYVSGKRGALREFANGITPTIPGISHIEDVRPLSALNTERRIIIPNSKEAVLVEVSLHTLAMPTDDVLRAFAAHVATVGGKLDLNRTVEVAGLIFLPLRINTNVAEQVAAFSFLRSIRPITGVRPIRPPSLLRTGDATYKIHSPAAVNTAIRVAVLDGGLPSNHGLPGVHAIDTIGVGAAATDALDHGMAVTSTLLWGAIDPSKPLPAPYCTIDHFRVVDTAALGNTDPHAYDILNRVKDVLETGTHSIVNISLGPDSPVDDTDVHPWTSTLDELASRGDRLVIVAAGNNGADPHPVCRVQPPSDGVNCLAVGASDRQDSAWARALYSAKGPGRRPGYKKPDIMAYGGSDGSRLTVVRATGNGHALGGVFGTSYAAPIVARTAAGLLAAFGTQLSALTLKCLLIHTADPREHPAEDVGWGHIQQEKDIAECPPGVARVIYQGVLTPRRFLRARIPVPHGLKGEVGITITICYATEISAADPMNYTNSGVRPIFRPHSQQFNVNENTGRPGQYPKSAPFFRGDAYADEEEQRNSEGKWETVLHASVNKRTASLHEPVLDLHYIPRLGAGDHPNPSPMPYSMVVTVSSKDGDLHDKILSEFSELREILPVDQLPSAGPISV